MINKRVGISVFIVLVIMLSCVSFVDASTSKSVTEADVHVKVENVKTGMKVSWNKISSASGYYVYKKVDDRYKRIKTIDSNQKTSVTITKSIRSGGKYKFKVVAYKDKKKSAPGYASKTYMKYPGLSIKLEGKGVRLNWRSVNGATKYLIYRKLNSGKWVKYGEAPGEYRNSFYITKVIECGKSFTFAVVAYSPESTSWGKKAGVKISVPKHKYVHTTVVKSCTSKGYDLYKCSRCGNSYKENEEYFDKHNYTPWAIKEVPTKTNPGLKSRVCKVCGTVAEAPIYTGNPIVDEALKYVGNRFVRNGKSLRDGIDCSRFVYRILKDTVAFDKPWLISYNWVKYGTPVESFSKAKAGDIIVLDGHLAIFMGNGKVVHASRSKPYPNGGIWIADFGSNEKMIDYFEGYRKEKILGIRRFLGEGYKSVKTRDTSLENAGALKRTVVYSGTEKTPPIWASSNKGNFLVKGLDYSVKYSNNVSVGRGKAVVKSLDGSGATRTVGFKIIPKAPEITNVKTGQGYVTLKINTNALKLGGSNLFVQRKLKNGSNWVKVGNYGNTVTTIKARKLKKGSRYKFRIRAYKIINDVSYRSKWSNVVTSGKVK